MKLVFFSMIILILPYAAKDSVYNHAVIFKEQLEQKLKVK